MQTSNHHIALKLEKANSLSHALGILFGLVCMPVLIYNAWKDPNPSWLIGAWVYAACFLMVFISSTVYHGLQQPRVKEIMKIVDHISIYFLIAGTYTPIILVFVNNSFGYTLLVTLWSLTFIGIFFKIFFTGRYEIVSTLLYVLMGWILFIDNKTFFAAMPFNIILLIGVGGVLYSLGVIFYLWQNYTYHHIIWHFFVLAAAICHYVAILKAV